MDPFQRHDKPTSKYLWKYLDIYKFLDFIHSGDLIFARMDSFDDVFELMSSHGSDVMRSLQHMANSRPHNWRSGDSSDHISMFEQAVLMGIYESRKLQKSFFASCFYSSDAESIAMWNLYSGMQGVAIRFEAELLYERVERYYEEHLRNQYSFYFGNITYKDVREDDLYKEDGEFKKSAFYDYSLFRKSEIYKHENEYRFVFEDSSMTEIKEKIIRIPIKDLEGTFFVSTETDEWQMKVLDNFIGHRLGEGVKVQKSQILDRKIITKYIENYTFRSLEKVQMEIIKCNEEKVEGFNLNENSNNE